VLFRQHYFKQLLTICVSRGAVKSNIGHLEGASGIAGIIKTILVLETGVIPPNANYEKTNIDIDEDFLRIKVGNALFKTIF
jgi:acyl transferase domain-containing protein